MWLRRDVPLHDSHQEPELRPMSWLMGMCGDNVADFWGTPQQVEAFVNIIHEITGAHLDWYSTGTAKAIMHLGLAASRRRVDLAIANLRDYPGVTIRRTYPASYRIKEYWQVESVG